MGVVVSAGKAFTPAPAGVHQAVCCDIVDLGLVATKWEGKERTSHKVYLIWQIEETNRETGKRFTVRRRYTASLHEKADLRRDLQSWRGKPFTSDELRAFDLDKVLGAGAQLNLVHVERDGIVYANVSAIMPVTKGQPKLAVVDYVREKDRPKDGPGQDTGSEDDAIPF